MYFDDRDRARVMEETQSQMTTISFPTEMWEKNIVVMIVIVMVLRVLV